ncbi:MAG TPA: ABC transporter permease, partial [Candidatus Acidoferrum sp.]|nr:ABC transporter permease [Candidatus Acidoferrum sp.]
MSELWRDVRYGVRLLWKSPGFTAVSLIALALGIGATTAIFSLLYAVLLAPLPYVGGDRIMMVWTHQKGQQRSVSPADYLDWQKQSKSFETVNAWTGDSFTISTPDWTEQVQASRVAPGFFDLLFGEKVALGRHFVADDALPGNDHVVILNNKFWHDRFGSDPNIVGTKLRMSGELYTVLGVAAPSASDQGESKMNVPLVFKAGEAENREARYLLVMGRLKQGVTVEAANAEMNVIAKQLEVSYPKTNKDVTVSVEPLKDDFLPKETKIGLWLMMGAVAFVLLIACVNIANLLLAWGTARSREIAVRAAQGASRWRIFRQFLIESLSLAVIGGVLGTVLAVGILGVVMGLMPRNQLGIPYEADPHLNVQVLLFTLGATLLSGVLFGCFPAWHASRQNISDMLKEGGRSSGSGGRNRLRRALVVAEFALALILVAGAGLILRSFWNVTQIDMGIRKDHILTFTVPVQHERTATGAQIRAVYKELQERIAAVPGVSNVGIALGLPRLGAP